MGIGEVGGGRAVLWLDPGMKDVTAATDLLKPYDARLMPCYPVNTRINYVANDDEACSSPVELLVSAAAFRKEHCGLIFSTVEGDLNSTLARTTNAHTERSPSV